MKSSISKTNNRTILNWTITNFVIAILTVTFTLSAIFLVTAVGQIRTMAYEKNRILLNAVLDRTYSFLEQTTSGMQDLGSALFDLSADDEDTLARIIDGVRIGSINLRSIDIISSDARVLYSSPYNATTIGNDVSGRDTYQRVVSEGTPSWSRVFYADSLDDVVITFYVPAGSYVLAGNLSLQRLWTSMEKIDISDETSLSIIDSNGAYIYDSDLSKVESRMFASNFATLMEEVRNGVQIIHHTEQEKRIRTEVATISGTKWLVAVNQNEEIINRAQNRLILSALAVMMVTIITGVVNIRRIARHNLEPFSRLQSIALRIADGEYNVEYPQSQFVEIASLSDGFRSMVTGIEQRENSLRDAREELEILNAELELKVEQRTAQLEASNKELEAFSYSVSHDLRAPLRHISGYVDLLNNRFRDALPEKAGHYLNEVKDSAQQMGALIDDLLQFSRTGRQELLQADIDMNIAVQETLEKLKPDTKDRNIFWNVAELPRTFGDYSLLKQVWMNLLDNAVKYTRYKNEAKIEVGFTREQGHWVFFVRDNGAGFDMQYAHKLFGVFQRLHPSSEFEGTGIGLANVQRIVHKHGGRVWAEAQPEKGAAFYFTIPDITFGNGGKSCLN